MPDTTRRVRDDLSGKVISFKWEGAAPPTEDDYALIIEASRKREAAKAPPKPDMSTRTGEWNPNQSLTERYIRASGVPREVFNSTMNLPVRAGLSFADWVAENAVTKGAHGVEEIKKGNYAKGGREVAQGVGTGALVGGAPLLGKALIAAPIPTAAAITTGGVGYAAGHPTVEAVGKSMGLTDDQAGLLADVSMEALAPVTGHITNKVVSNALATRTAQNLSKAAELSWAKLIKALPPTKKYNFGKDTWDAAMPHIEAHVQGPIKSLPEFVEAANFTTDAIENKIRNVIADYPKDTIPTKPYIEAMVALKSSPIADFEDNGMKWLAKKLPQLKGPITLEDADHIRKVLNAYNAKVLAKNRYDVAQVRASDPKFAAREAAAESLRQGIYGQLESRGIKGVADLRRAEGAVLELRNAAQARVHSGETELAGTGTPNWIRQPAAYIAGKMVGLSGVPMSGPLTQAAVNRGLGGNLTKNQVFAEAMALRAKGTPPVYPVGPGGPQPAIPPVTPMAVTTPTGVQPRPGPVVPPTGGAPPPGGPTGPVGTVAYSVPPTPEPPIPPAYQSGTGFTPGPVPSPGGLAGAPPNVVSWDPRSVADAPVRATAPAAAAPAAATPGPQPSIVNRRIARANEIVAQNPDIDPRVAMQQAVAEIPDAPLPPRPERPVAPQRTPAPAPQPARPAAAAAPAPAPAAPPRPRMPDGTPLTVQEQEFYDAAIGGASEADVLGAIAEARAERLARTPTAALVNEPPASAGKKKDPIADPHGDVSDAPLPGFYPSEFPKRQRERLAAEHLASLWDTTAAWARRLDPEVDLARVRAAFDERLAAHAEQQAAHAEAVPFDDESLLRAIAKYGGIHEKAGGNTGEIARLREGERGGNFRGVGGVFRRFDQGRAGAKKDIGFSLDDMARLLQQEPEFAHIQTPNDLLNALEAVRIGNRPVPVVPGHADLDITPERRWWEPPTVKDLIRSDVLPTGEDQPRLPGDVGDVRDTNIETPKIDLPFSLSGGVSERPQGKTSALFGPETPEPPKAKADRPMRTAADIAREMGVLRQPRPLNKLYGPNPTKEQAALHADAVRAYNREMGRLRREHAVALERDNAAFREKNR